MTTPLRDSLGKIGEIRMMTSSLRDSLCKIVRL